MRLLVFMLVLVTFAVGFAGCVQMTLLLASSSQTSVRLAETVLEELPLCRATPGHDRVVRARESVHSCRHTRTT